MVGSYVHLGKCFGREMFDIGQHNICWNIAGAILHYLNQGVALTEIYKENIYSISKYSQLLTHK